MQVDEVQGASLIQVRKMLAQVKVRGLVKKAVTVHEKTPLNRCRSIMVEHEVGSILVTSSRDGSLIGILTERDVARLDPTLLQIGESLVTDAMTTPVMSLRSDASFLDVLRFASKSRVRHVPFVDRGGMPEGILSIVDVVDLLANERS